MIDQFFKLIFVLSRLNKVKNDGHFEFSYILDVNGKRARSRFSDKAACFSKVIEVFDEKLNIDYLNKIKLI